MRSAIRNAFAALAIGAVCCVAGSAQAEIFEDDYYDVYSGAYDTTYGDDWYYDTYSYDGVWDDYDYYADYDYDADAFDWEEDGLFE